MHTPTSKLVSPLALASLLAATAAAQTADPAGGFVPQAPSLALSTPTNPSVIAQDPMFGITLDDATTLNGGGITYSGANAVDFVPGSGTCGTNQGQTIGWAFDVTSPVTVCAMSWFDDGANGLDLAHEVGIWTPGGTLIAATHVVIPAGTAATLDGIWRTVAIPPTTLPAGNGYIVGGYNGSHGECLNANVTQTPHPSINYIDATFSLLNGIFEPPTNFSSAVNGFYGVGFQVTAGQPGKQDAVDFVAGSGLCGTNQGQSIGWAFDVLQPVTVTSMSWFDDGQNGLDIAHEVAIWSPSGALIPATNVVIPAGTAATLDGIWRVVSIPPTTLPAGNGYIVGGYNGSHGECLSFNVTQTVHPNLSYFDATFSSLGASLTRPDLFSAAVNGFYGVGFQIDNGGGGPSAYCNPGNPNSVNAGGAVLASAGGYGTAGATFNLTQVPNQPGLLYAGPNQINLAFGCGQRCVGGFVIRGTPFTPSGNQALGVPYDMSAPTSLNIQYWYRDPANFGVCGDTFNLSNALMP